MEAIACVKYQACSQQHPKPDTQRLKATINFFYPGAVATYIYSCGRVTPFTVPTDVGLVWYHLLGAWLVEQKALHPQLYEAIMVKCLA